MKQVRGHEVKNTVSRVQMHPVKQLYQTKLKSFFPPVRFAFAYGSAVFTQFGKPKVIFLCQYLIILTKASELLSCLQHSFRVGGGGGGGWTISQRSCRASAARTNLPWEFDQTLFPSAFRGNGLATRDYHGTARSVKATF